MLLVNKADLLTRQQRREWARHFEKEGLRAVFWSALAESNRLDAEDKGMEVDDAECGESDPEEEAKADNEDLSQKGADGEEEVKADVEDQVGYPNVGKSSTINTILRNKKVSVSATPGHTKHFQTLYVEQGLCLCDCPGLVMPSFVSTKAEMICSGILPIDQMRDHTVPRHVLEGTYGINIIRPREDEDPDRHPTSEELLMAYGYMRGFMTSHGQPDQSRSARYILKDFVSGKLLYCHPPPHINAEDFQPQHSKFQQTGCDVSTITNKQVKIKRIENVVDKNFFHQENVRALSKGVQSVMGYKPGSGPVGPAKAELEMAVGKPWKKHGNRNKKEKVRRLNKHLDA
ncbi:hypothetical protein INR49_019504 [Caranx melampygus]|nr:hypothetical protein INR49_019504 [Caranx melampygus]